MLNGIKGIGVARVGAALSVMVLVAQVAHLVETVRTSRELVGLLADRASELSEAVLSLEATLDERLAVLEQELSVITSESSGISRRVGVLGADARKQYEEVKKLRGTYEGLLEEERKMRIVTAAQDGALSDKVREADELYRHGEYAQAYQLYEEALPYRPDAMNVRACRVKSLFNMNRLDSGVYDEVLAELVVLERNGVVDAELDEIAAFIRAERGGKR